MMLSRQKQAIRINHVRFREIMMGNFHYFLTMTDHFIKKVVRRLIDNENNCWSREIISFQQLNSEEYRRKVRFEHTFRVCWISLVGVCVI